LRDLKKIYWQTIRDWSEQFQLLENTDWRRKNDLHKINRIYNKIQYFVWFCIKIRISRLLDFLYNQIVLCEISKKISLTNHPRLVRKVPAPGKYWLQVKSWMYQNHTNYDRIVNSFHYFVPFWWFFDFWMFLCNQIELCKISKNISLTNHPRLVREVPAPGTYWMETKSGFSQNHSKMT